jgi:hypothetical protein
MLGSSCRASRGSKRGASSLTLQSVGVLRGTGAAWKRGSLGRERGAILAITQSARRWNAPRSLSERIALRGVVRDPAIYAVERPSFARGKPPGAGNTREGFRLSSHCSRDKRGVRYRFEEGPRPSKRRREPSLESARSAQGTLLRRHALRGSSARVRPREGADEGEGAREVVTSPRRTRMRSGSRSVPVHRTVCRKSAERPRAQRSASPVATGSKARSVHGAREREPDHRGRSGAQAQGHVDGKRGAWHLGSAILIT